MTDLLPCPFCGSEAVLVDQSPGYSGAHVQCVDCDCMGQSWRVVGDNDRAASQAIAAWNTRTPPQITDAMVDAACKEYDINADRGSSWVDSYAMRAALAAAMGVR